MVEWDSSASTRSPSSIVQRRHIGELIEHDIWHSIVQHLTLYDNVAIALQTLSYETRNITRRVWTLYTSPPALNLDLIHASLASIIFNIQLQLWP